MSYSLALRQWVVAATNHGMTIGRAAEVFQVSVATIERWRRQVRETGDLAPRTSPGRPRLIAPNQEADLIAQLQAHPDATVAEHRRHWAAQTGTRVSPATLCRTFQRLRWTLKKRIDASERDPGGC